jgi:hypothetical protein
MKIAILWDMTPFSLVTVYHTSPEVTFPQAVIFFAFALS